MREKLCEMYECILQKDLSTPIPGDFFSGGALGWGEGWGCPFNVISIGTSRNLHDATFILTVLYLLSHYGPQRVLCIV